MDINEVLKNHLDTENKLLLYPSKRKLKVAAMFYISYGFERNKKYTEKEVNEIINNACCFRDHALLRREMYVYGFFDREIDGSAYWLRDEQPLPESYGLK